MCDLEAEYNYILCFVEITHFIDLKKDSLKGTWEAQSSKNLTLDLSSGRITAQFLELSPCVTMSGSMVMGTEPTWDSLCPSATKFSLSQRK